MPTWDFCILACRMEHCWKRGSDNWTVCCSPSLSLTWYLFLSYQLDLICCKVWISFRGSFTLMGTHLLQSDVHGGHETSARRAQCFGLTWFTERRENSAELAHARPNYLWGRLESERVSSKQMYTSSQFLKSGSRPRSSICHTQWRSVCSTCSCNPKAIVVSLSCFSRRVGYYICVTILPMRRLWQELILKYY